MTRANWSCFVMFEKCETMKIISVFTIEHFSSSSARSFSLSYWLNMFHVDHEKEQEREWAKNKMKITMKKEAEFL